ncbi:MAG: GtrA family protein [Chloroflexi bacterium]|nr:GtrA family protein [Chloroflexota bacterium]
MKTRRFGGRPAERFDRVLEKGWEIAFTNGRLRHASHGRFFAVIIELCLREARRFVRYGTVGALGTATDVAVMLALVRYAGLVPVLANAAGFVVAVCQNFILNRRLTFPESRGAPASGQLTRFFIASLVGLAINLPVFLFVDSSLNPYLGANSYKAAKMCAIGVVLVWNYLANRLWTFRQ